MSMYSMIRMAGQDKKDAPVVTRKGDVSQFTSPLIRKATEGREEKFSSGMHVMTEVEHGEQLS